MAGTVGVDEVEAPEGLFAVGFMSGDFADAGGVFEAGSGEAGGTVDPAVFPDPAEQGVRRCDYKRLGKLAQAFHESHYDGAPKGVKAVRVLPNGDQERLTGAGRRHSLQ
jgi:hypothetical protein